MKVKYIEKTEPLCLTEGKVYEVLSIEGPGWYRIIDDTDEDYLYAPECFEVVDNSPIQPDSLERALAAIGA